MPTTQTLRDTPSVVSSQIPLTVAELAVTVTLLVCVVSMWTMALGDPELIAIVACTGVITVLLARMYLAAAESRTDRYADLDESVCETPGSTPQVVQAD